ncbi:MAG TPA: DUF502 domain-containing protein [Burkholderiales bacterium]|nr:DUF502 domain-containing protein [Burkholderiales bacterium]
MKPHLGRIFLTGLLTLIPAVATIYLMVWLIGAVDRTFGKPLRWLMPDETYLAGMGIVVAIAITFGVGILMHGVLFRQIFRKAEQAMLALPLVRSIYSAVKDLIGLFGRDGPAMQVVSVTFPGTSWKLLGFVTREEFTDLPAGVGTASEVAVYLPMSYQVGGYTVIVPREAIRPLDMSREEALKFILTAGLKTAGDPRKRSAAAPAPARTRPS